MHAAAGAVAALLLLAPARAFAGEDADLIPRGVLETAAEPATGGEAPPLPAERRRSFSLKMFAEDALSAWSAPARVSVPYPAPLPSWQNRTSLDARLEWPALPELTLTLSDRLNVFEEDRQKFASADTVRNDLREASVTWQPAQGLYLEAGRINVRNGSALGFNPTDFFKTRSLVGQASLDPSVIRQDRLGTLMLRTQRLWTWGSTSIAYAPKVAEPSPVVDQKPVGVDPRFDATNATHRVLCTLSLELLELSPQLLGYFELHRPKLGANLSRTLGDAVVVYGEWAGGPEQDLSARAATFGRRTRTLPPTAPALPPTNPKVKLENDVAAGFSWTVATALTFNVEYHFHEAGFGRRDWKRWFELGSAPSPAGLSSELWFVRAYAADQQEPMSKHELFVRVDWPRALTPDLELSAFAFVSLLDGSVLSQLSASYYVSDAWTASAYVSGNIGGERSERGSLPRRGNAILQLTRYF